MLPDKTRNNTNGEKNEDPLNAEQPAKSGGIKDEHVKEAYRQAEEDIEHDPDTPVPEPADDLDEGESVNLNDDETALI
jgi:hypothetical protein